MRTMGAAEWGLLLTLSLLWGGSFFFVEIMVGALDPMSVVLARVAPAAVALTLYVHLRGHRLPRGAVDWTPFAVMAALNNVMPFALIAWGQGHIDSGLAAILNATTPLFTVLLAHALTADERLTPNRLASVLIGLAGVVVLVGPRALAGLGAGVLVQLAILGAALSYACAGIWGKRLAVHPPPVAAACMLLASTALALPLAVVFGAPLAVAPGPAVWGAIAGVSLLSTAAAYLIYFRVLARAGATNLLLVTFLIPPSALTLGIAFLGERPDWTAYAGMALIFAGLAAVDGRLLRRRRAVSP